MQIVKIYNGTSSPHGSRFLNYQKLRIETTNHSPLSWPFELHVKQNTEQHRLWLAHFFLLSDALYSSVWSCLLDSTSLFRKISFISIFCWYISWNRKRKVSVFENGEIKDLSWKKKPARCFVSSRDQSMLRFCGYLLLFHLASDWSRCNKHARNFL